MKHFFVIAVLIVASTFAIHAGMIDLHLLPKQASLQAVSIDQLFAIYMWATAFVFSLIIIPFLYSLILFRRRKGETGDGAHISGNSALEITWTIVPLIAVIYLAFLGAQSLAKTRQIDQTAMVVKVIAGQWYFQFQYPDYGIATAELTLPVDRQVDLQMTSNDVIHSFFVPEFRLKQDILPGRTTELRITPTVIGTYTVECAQLCGANHAYMHATVQVDSQQGFDTWVASQKAAAGQNPALVGEQLAGQYGCAVCHSTDGTTKIGPTWKGLYLSQVLLADGTKVTADQTYLKNHIINPNLQVVAGFPAGVMPQTFGQILTQTQISDLIAYIESLK